MGVMNSPVDTVPEEAEIAIFLDKDIKSDVMPVLKQLNETILQELKSKAWRQCLSKHECHWREILKKNYREILELKSTVTVMKNSPDSLNNRFGQTDEGISKFEDNVNWDCPVWKPERGNE